MCCGRPITNQEIKQIQETVSIFSNLSRKELSQTICEHLNWHTAAGANKVDACMKMFEKLEDMKALNLPAKRAMKKHKKSKILITERTNPHPAITGNVGDLDNVNLEIVTAEDRVKQLLRPVEALTDGSWRIPYVNCWNGNGPITG